MYQLKNWSLSISDGDTVVGFISGAPLVENISEMAGHIKAHGIVSGHHRLADGTYIHTSRMEKLEADVENGRFVVVTHSGSNYELKFGEADLKNPRNTDAVLAGFHVSEEVLQEVKTLSNEWMIQKEKEEEKRNRQRKKDAESALSNNELYLIMEENEEYSYYKDNDSQVHEIPVRLSLGMFEDTYMIKYWDEKNKQDISFVFVYRMSFANHYPVIETVSARNFKAIRIKNDSSINLAFRKDRIKRDEQEILCPKGDVTVIELLSDKEGYYL